MTISVTPKFTLEIEDDDLAEAAGQVTPTRWNDGSEITMSSGKVIGRMTAGDGPAEEITLGTAASKDTGTASGNVPILDGSGKLDTSILPAIAVTDVFVVASQSAMLALTAEKGDIAIRSDLNKSFALSTNSPSTLADWKELLTSTDAVLSVNGKTGSVTLTPDDLDDASTTNKFASAANVASVTHAATSKTTPVDADELPLIDSAASNVLKKLTWANLKAALKASASAFWAGTSDALFLTPKNVKDAAAWFAITSGTTPGWDTQSGVNARIVLNHNATFAAPTNLIDGWTYTLLIVQGTTGGTGAFNSIWDFGDAGAPTLSSGSGKRDLVVGIYDATTTKLIASFRKGA